MTALREPPALPGSMHPLVKGFLFGIFTGGLAMLAAFAMAAAIRGTLAHGPGIDRLPEMLLLCWQLVFIGQLPVAPVAAILYRSAERMPGALPYALLAGFSLLVLVGLSLLMPRFYPAPAPTVDFALMAFTFVVTSDLVWFATMRARKSRKAITFSNRD